MNRPSVNPCGTKYWQSCPNWWKIGLVAILLIGLVFNRPASDGACLGLLAIAHGSQDASDVEFIYECRFEGDSDINYDDWPDDWRRQTGTGFPQYNRLTIQVDPLDPNNRVMELALDGGQAALYSPPIKIDQQCSYRLRCRLNLPQQPEHGREAWASLTLFDAEQQPLSVHRLPILQNTDGWVELESSLITVESTDVVAGIIGLHVRPTAATSLFGKAYFDDVTLQELPRLHLEFSNPLHVFITPESVRLTCRVSGMRRSESNLRFDLFNERGKLLNSEVYRLDKETQISKVVVARDGTSQGFAWQELNWQLVSSDLPQETEAAYGYYRLAITLMDREVNPLVREMSFVVMPPENIGRETLFGCVFPNSIIHYDQYGLGSTLQHLGINWLKLPIWLDHQDQVQTAALGNLLQRLARLEIDVVGILDEPPPRIYQKFWQHEHGIAALTNDVDTFLEAIQPLLIEWSLRIDRWQIGSDEDSGIAENLVNIDKMQKIKEHFRKYGEQTKIGLPWHWMMQRPKHEKQHWDFQCLVADPPLTSGEMEYNLRRLQSESVRESYVGIQPLDRRSYDLATRVQELCRQMIEVKRSGFSRAYVPNPMHPDSGLFSQENNPSEILLPWRTLAVHLNGAQYLGPIQLPNGSVNHWFSKNDQAFAFVWNEQETRETLYLGPQARVSDLWGRNESIDLVDGAQSIRVDKWPRLWQGLDLSVALIRLSIQFDRTSLDNVSSQQQPLQLQFQNHFPHGVRGNVFLSNTDLFSQDIRLPFQSGRGERIESIIPVVLRSDAITDQHLLRLDFKLTNDELPSFSAWKSIRVGSEDVEFVTRQKLEDNRFVTVITLINRTDHPVTYSVMLRPKDRKHSSVMFYGAPPGQSSKSIVLYNANDLVGTNLWMRATDEKRLRSMNFILKVE